MSDQLKRILVAEDNHPLREMIVSTLAQEYEAVGVAGGLDMEKELEKQKYDLVIADLNLPDQPATVVFQRVGAAQAQGEASGPAMPPALVITGMDAEDLEVLKVRRMAQVQEVLFKPIGVHRLLRWVAEFFGERAIDTSLSERGMDAVAMPMPYLLVVDDDSQIRDMLSLMLEGEGYQVRACADSDRAVELCQTTRFDHILLDYMLDGVTADQFLDDLQEALGPEALPPLTLVTGFQDCLDVANFAEYPQVKGILSKPFTKEDLLRVLQGDIAANSHYSVASVT